MYPSDKVTLKAGTEDTPALIFPDGVLTDTPKQGAMEYKANTFYLTNYQVRRSVALGQNVPIADITVANTVVETVIYSIGMNANYLQAGKQIETILHGVFSSVAGANGVATFRIKYGGTAAATIASVAGANTNSPFSLDIATTCRAIGAGTAGKLITSSRYEEGIADRQVVAGPLTNIDTTINNTIQITVQWATASASNTLLVRQARTLCIDNA